MLSGLRFWVPGLNINPWLGFRAVGSLLACLILVTHCSRSSVLAAQGKSGTCHPMDLNFDPGVDVHAMENFKSVVADLIKQERFDDLDCIADQFVLAAQDSGVEPGNW